MKTEFKSFLKEKRYVQKVSNHPIAFYKYSYQAFKRGGLDFQKFGKAHFIEILSNLREGGMNINCTDACIWGFNPFLSWLFKNGHTSFGVF